MALPNHNQDAAEYSIYEMVRNRLSMIEDTPTNQALIGKFTLEVMYELEPCFKVAATTEGDDPTRIGNEANYTLLMRSTIADIVAIYCLQIIGAGGKFSDSVTDTGKIVDGIFLKKAKAGSVETEFEQFDIKKSSGELQSTDTLLNLYKKAAQRKSRTLGCIFDICDDCSIEFASQGIALPFWIPNSGGCGCC